MSGKREREEGRAPEREENSELMALLQSVGAEAAFEPLRREFVDVDALKLMGDEELREAGVPLGPRIKLLKSDICRGEHLCGERGWNRRRGEDPSRTEDVQGRVWDMESTADVKDLQSKPTILTLDLESGRIHSAHGRNMLSENFLVEEDDVPFIVLMRKVRVSLKPIIMQCMHMLMHVLSFSLTKCERRLCLIQEGGSFHMDAVGRMPPLMTTAVSAGVCARSCLCA
jgi:hypothetical protein